MSTRPESVGSPVAGDPILAVTDLTVTFTDQQRARKQVVYGIDFEVERGGALAMVGESGSGKSVSTRGVFQLLPGNAEVGGSARWSPPGEEPIELIGASAARVRNIRGVDVGFVFQNAMQALNPTLTLERQLTEHLLWHRVCSPGEARKRAIEALDRVGIPQPRRRVKMYPFQLSGGMRQRAMIAMATIARPKLLIADEPTTALDVTVQRQILELLKELRDDGLSMIMITHDLGVARYLCDEAVVLRNGEKVESGPIRTVIDQPSADYTRQLVAASLEVDPNPPDRSTDEPEITSTADPDSAPLLAVDDLVKVFVSRKVETIAVDGVSFELTRGRTLGVVGESGSGKSTLARLVMRLIEPTSGQVSFRGKDLLAMGKHPLRQERRAMQLVFQNPYGSLLPNYDILTNIIEPLRLNRIGTRASRIESAHRLLDLVQLPRFLGQAYPRQLSGGQQQRVAIARALILEPELVVADEPTSSLDASVQIQVLDLLTELQSELGFGMMLITHNLAVVEELADEVMVMKSGQVVEHRPTGELFRDPQQPYTQELLGAVLPVTAG